MIVCYISNEEAKMNASLDEWIIKQLPMTFVHQKVKFIPLSKVNEMLYVVSSPLWHFKKILRRCSEEQSSFELGGEKSNSFWAATPLSTRRSNSSAGRSGRREGAAAPGRSRCAAVRTRGWASPWHGTEGDGKLLSKAASDSASRRENCHPPGQHVQGIRASKQWNMYRHPLRCKRVHFKMHL